MRDWHTNADKIIWVVNDYHHNIDLDLKLLWQTKIRWRHNKFMLDSGIKLDISAQYTAGDGDAKPDIGS